jgi:hypothetical protein
MMHLGRSNAVHLFSAEFTISQGRENFQQVEKIFLGWILELGLPPGYDVSRPIMKFKLYKCKHFDKFLLRYILVGFLGHFVKAFGHPDFVFPDDEVHMPFRAKGTYVHTIGLLCTSIVQHVLSDQPGVNVMIFILLLNRVYKWSMRYYTNSFVKFSYYVPT